MPEARTPVLLILPFASSYDSLSLSLSSDQLVLWPRMNKGCVWRRMEADVCFPWIHIKESLVLPIDTLLAVCPFINNTLFSRSLVMNAYARLLCGVTSMYEALLNVRVKCDRGLALMGYYYFDFKDSRARHLRLPHFTCCPV